MKHGLALLTLAVILGACSELPGNINPPPPPPPTGTFTMTSTPDKATFSVPKGLEAPLTITITINSSKTAKVKLSTYIGTTGVQISPSTITITGNGTTQFIVKDAGIAEDKPYFYIYGQGLSSNNNPSGQELKRIDYQWTVQ